MQAIRFAKMSGAGNDFIVLDGRGQDLRIITPDFIRRVCRRGLSVGADGLMILENSSEADFRMRYFNADGSEAAMCGNGGRCIARFAVLVNAVSEDKPIRFSAASGLYHARVQGPRVELSLIPPQAFESDRRLSLKSGECKVDYTVLGVPHAVLFMPDVEKAEVKALGREIRNHEAFAPQGTNVNFCQVVDRHHLRLRTYERGVEDETLACGTGAAATTILASRRGWVDSPVTVRTQGGQDLELRFQATPGGFSEVYQSGEARLIYWGDLSEEALK